MPTSPEKEFQEFVPEFKSVDADKRGPLRDRAFSDAETFLKACYMELGGKDLPKGPIPPDNTILDYLDHYNKEMLETTGRPLTEDEFEAYMEAFRLRCQMGYPLRES